jgi:hypothetical protein
METSGISPLAELHFLPQVRYRHFQISGIDKRIRIRTDTGSGLDEGGPKSNPAFRVVLQYISAINWMELMD